MTAVGGECAPRRKENIFSARANLTSFSRFLPSLPPLFPFYVADEFLLYPSFLPFTLFSTPSIIWKRASNGSMRTSRRRVKLMRSFYSRCLRALFVYFQPETLVPRARKRNVPAVLESRSSFYYSLFCNFHFLRGFNCFHFPSSFSSHTKRRLQRTRLPGSRRRRGLATRSR